MKYFRRGEGAYDFAGGAGLPLSADEGSSRLRDQMGEYVLAQAVLWQAIREYQQLANFRTRRQARLFHEVHQWFSENDEKWDFSFVNLCQILDLEPTCIRAALQMWRQRAGKQQEDVRFRTVQRKTLTRPRGRHQVGFRQAAGRDTADARVLARGG